jgi:hypothetical protein
MIKAMDNYLLDELGIKPITISISPNFLQRKFKLSFSYAKQICEIFEKLHLVKTWNDVRLSLPKHKETVIVYGRLKRLKTKKKQDHYLAVFDAHSGWYELHNKDALYVTKWTAINIDKSEKENESSLLLPTFSNLEPDR